MCWDDLSCHRDGWIWLVSTPQPLWCARCYCTIIHWGSFHGCDIKNLLWPLKINVLPVQRSQCPCSVSFAGEILVPSSAQRAQAACTRGICSTSASTHTHESPIQVCWTSLCFINESRDSLRTIKRVAAGTKSACADLQWSFRSCAETGRLIKSEPKEHFCTQLK